MYVLKWILLIAVFCTSTTIGILISKKYSSRVQILKEIKNALNIFEVKINFSCATIPEIFNEISQKIKGSAGKIFADTVEIIKNKDANLTAGEAWEKALEDNSENLKKEDIESIKPLGRLLGNTDVDGQINQIELVCEFLEEQIAQATEEKNKNEKLYQKLGAIVGLVIVIVLI